MEIKRVYRFVALAVAMVLFALPVGCEIAYTAGLIPASPTQAVLSAFGVGSSGTADSFVEFLSVGQGNCAVIKSQDCAAIIDFGPPESSEKIYRRLQQLGILRLDLAVITHHQQDHMGGLLHLMDCMEIDRLLVAEDTAEDGDAALYQAILNKADDCGTVIYPPRVGGKFQIGQAVLEVLYSDQTAAEENNRSLVTRLTLNEKRVLFTGDLEAVGEKALLKLYPDLRCEVFALGHHGSNTSNSDAFLSQIRPNVAVASCGYDHPYGHPSTQVLARLKNHSIAVYRTDLDKTVRCSLSREAVTVQTEREGIEE